MKLATRIGALTTAGLMACGSLGAAHADVLEPQPTETAQEPQSSVDESTLETPTESSTEVSPTRDPSVEPGPSQTPERVPMTCELATAEDGLATIEVPDADPGDVVHVGNSTPTVGDQLRIEANYVLGEPIELELQGGEDSPTRYCEITITEDNEDTPGEPTDDATNTPDEPTEDATNTPEPEPTPTEPSETDEPEPSPTETQEPEVPAPTPTPPDETWPEPAPTQPVVPPTTEAPATSAPDNNEPVPRPSPDTPRDPSSGPVEREIRQFSTDPRRLLSQLWGTDSNNGSRLIMPGPRDADETPTIETLPPVSEDELNAIKAERSAPDRNATGAPSDEALNADVDERLSGTGSWWLLTGIAGLVCISAGVWWVIARRKPEH